MAKVMQRLNARIRKYKAAPRKIGLTPRLEPSSAGRARSSRWNRAVIKSPTTPHPKKFVSGTPKDALAATLEMYEITFAEHKYFTIPYLEFRGTPTGIDIRKVIEKNIAPRINTGIAHKDAGVGQIGAGLVRAPMKVFEDALIAYAERYGL